MWMWKKKEPRNKEKVKWWDKKGVRTKKKDLKEKAKVRPFFLAQTDDPKSKRALSGMWKTRLASWWKKVFVALILRKLHFD